MTMVCGSIAAPTPGLAAVRAMSGAWPEPTATAIAPSAPVSLGGTHAATCEGELAVVGDVRIDNRAQLGAELSASDEDDDHALVLAAWRRWGVACCGHLIGDYAFAVWDEGAGRLFCARDLVGAKPFYYWVGRAGAFAFASQLAALLAHPDVERRLDRTAAMHHLLFLTHDTRRTLFAGVARLAPGHALTLAPGGTPHVWRHGDLGPDDDLDRPTTLEGWSEQLADALDVAVTDRLHASGRVGAHVSGGLDSSAVAAIAAGAVGRDGLVGVSFSVAPASSIGGDTPVDGPFVAAVGEHCGIAIEHPQPDLVSFPEALRLAAPGMMPPPYGTTSMHEQSASSIDTMLSGWGGDEAASFNGRSHLADCVRHGRAVELARSVRHTGVSRRRVPRLLWQHALVPFAPDPFITWQGRRQGDPTVDRLPASVVDEGAAADLGVVDEVRHPLRTRTTTRATQLALLHNGHLARRMEEWSADAARYGIDYRHPLLDTRVLGVALAAPSEAFLQRGMARWLFRKATESALPPSVAWRRDKRDSWMQRRMAVAPAATSTNDSGRWVLGGVERLLADGNDLSGTVDLAKLRRSVAGRPTRYSDSKLVTNAPLLAAVLAVQLAAFAEHNRISV